MEGNETISGGMRLAYTQDWPAYNKAQVHEGEMFMQLLASLCKNLEQPVYEYGRPRKPMADMAFAVCLKVYSTLSLRRFMSLMRTAKEKGYIDEVCSFQSISNYMNNRNGVKMRRALNSMIAASCTPLASVESDFAADSTGFSISQYERWFDHKYGKTMKSKPWLKLHVMCGTRTNIITSAVVTGIEGGDSTQLEKLSRDTGKSFAMEEVSADKAYSSRDNFDMLSRMGAIPFIPFKTNSRGNARGSMAWSKMYHYFMYHQEEFMSHYHKRSNVESTFSMIKAKFGTKVRSKDRLAQENEILAKVMCHNICVLIQEMHELGIEAKFTQN